MTTTSGDHDFAIIRLRTLGIASADDHDKTQRRKIFDLYAARYKSAFGKKCFSYKGAKLRNDLSVEIESSKSEEIFKKHINNANTEC